MGIHCGFLVAGRPWDAVRDALRPHCGEFTEVTPVDRAAWGLQQPGQNTLFVAEHNDKTHMLDTTMVLTSARDLVPALSRALDCTVGAAIGESISGTYSLVVAEGGEVRRNYFNVAVQFPEPFSKGVPLEAEALQPLEDPDGQGLLGCLASLGFSTEALLGSFGGTRLIWPGDRFPEAGPLTAELKEYAESLPADDSWMKNVNVVERAPGEFDIRSTPAQPSSRSKRLFKR
jgi:hypothetical protein